MSTIMESMISIENQQLAPHLHVNTSQVMDESIGVAPLTHHRQQTTSSQGGS